VLIYATPGDLTSWSGNPAPDNATGLLRSASSLVGRYTRAARYRTTTDGLPSDPPVAEAFRDATTAQAAFWATNGIDPNAGSLAEMSKGHAIGKSIKGASVNYSVTLVENSNKARTQAVTVLCDEAWLILDNAGLVGGQPV
jgi:hypothetical protein